MKRIVTLLLLLITSAAHSQQLTAKQWEKEAITNKRLMPKYGNLPKNDPSLKADYDVAGTFLAKETNRDGSDQLIGLGFQALSTDMRAAMYRFNQAYLADSTNPEIYSGYGAVYMTLGDYERAGAQYKTGLSLSPGSTHLLTDYGSYFLAQYYGLESFAPEEATRNIDSAIKYLSKSYNLDPKDANTSFKLSVCYSRKKDCNNAWKYYNACKALGGEPITDEFVADLESRCGKHN